MDELKRYGDSLAFSIFVLPNGNAYQANGEFTGSGRTSQFHWDGTFLPVILTDRITRYDRIDNIREGLWELVPGYGDQRPYAAPVRDYSVLYVLACLDAAGIDTGIPLPEPVTGGCRNHRQEAALAYFQGKI